MLHLYNLTRFKQNRMCILVIFDYQEEEVDDNFVTIPVQSVNLVDTISTTEKYLTEIIKLHI